jgi:hypothetical protein
VCFVAALLDGGFPVGQLIFELLEVEGEFFVFLLGFHLEEGLGLGLVLEALIFDK